MILRLDGHIGANASALIDGQLGPAETERAWSHVLRCPGCRALVEREGWVKRQLAGLSSRPTPGPALPSRLADTLAGLEQVASAWAEVDRIERRSTRTRAAAFLAGAGSVGLAAAAILVLGGPATDDLPAGPAPASIRPGVVGAALEGAIPAGVRDALRSHAGVVAGSVPGSVAGSGAGSGARPHGLPARAAR